MAEQGSGFGLGSPPGGYGSSGSEMSILGGSGPVPAGGGYRPPKKGSGGLVALIVVAVLAVGGLVTVLVLALSGKSGAIGADPTSLPPKRASAAHEHLPAGCDVVARGSFAKLLEVPAVKTHLVPVLDEVQAGGSDPEAKQVAELTSLIGIDAKNDLKDVAVCVRGMNGPRSGQHVLVVAGGELRPETVVPAMEKVDVRRREKPEVSKVDGRFVAKGKMNDGSTFVLGQAEDGAIVMANDPALFASAMAKSPAHEREYALPLGPEMAVVVAAGALKEAVSRGGPNPFLRDVNEIQRAFVTASFADAKLELRIVTGSAQAAKSLQDVYNLMLAPLLRQELAAAKGKVPGVEVLTNAKAAVDGRDFVLAAQGSAADVDAAAKELARLVREQKKSVLGL